MSAEWWILEPRHSGHRLWYVSLATDHLRRAGRAFKVATSPESRRSQEWRAHLRAVNPEVVPSGGTLGSWYVDAFERVPAASPAIVPDGEPALSYLCRHPRQTLTIVLLMRPLPQGRGLALLRYAAKLVVMKVALTRSKGKLQALYLRPAPGKPVRILDKFGARGVEDPVKLTTPNLDAAEWRAKFGLPGESAIYLLAGDISPRKAAGAIIDAFEARAPSDNVTLVLVGRHHPSVTERLESLPPSLRHRILSIDSYLADDDFDTWITYADIILLLYTNRGSSGLMLKAAAAGTAAAVLAGSDLERTASLLGVVVVPIAKIHSDLALTFTEHQSLSSARRIPTLPQPEEFAAQLVSGRGAPRLT